MKKLLGFLIFILAILGGLHAIGSSFNGNNQNQLEFSNSKEAEGFAAAFVKAYYEVPADSSLIAEFTNLYYSHPYLPDVENEVIGVWPLSNTIDPATQLVHVKLIMETESRYIDSNDLTQKKVKRYWMANVQVLRNQDGKLIIYNYPSLNQVEKGNSILTLESQASQAADNMKPMLESFFKTYLAAEKPEDIANFFAVQNVVTPKGGAFAFQKLRNVNAYGKGPWLVFADVQVIDPLTKAYFMESYQLEVVNQQGKFFINKINQ